MFPGVSVAGAAHLCVRDKEMVRSIILKEFLLSVVLGVLPALLSIGFGNVDGLKNFISASSVPNFLAVYFIIVLGIHVFIALYIYYHAWASRDEEKRKIKMISFVTGGVSEGMLGIYRLYSGILFIIPVILWAMESGTINLKLFVVMEILAMAFFGGACIVSLVAAWATNASDNLIKPTPKNGSAY